MPSRRTFLRLGTVVGAVGTAGCPAGIPFSDDDPEGGDWPTYRHDASNTGHTSTGGPTDDPEVKWSVDRDDVRAVSWPPSIVDDTVYVGDTRVSALDASTGEERWSVPSGDDDERFEASPLTVTAETLYAGGYRQYITALSATDGQEEWRYDVGAPVYAGPTVVDDTVYVGTDLGEVYALADGEARWSDQVAEQPTGRASGAPAVVDGVVYVTTDNLHRDDYQPGTYALDAETGEQLWFVATESAAGTFASPVVVDGSVYLVDVDGTVQALDAENGTERWRIDGGGNVEYSVAVADGSVFVPSDPLAVYDADTGDEQWRTDEVGSAIAPVVAGETLYVTSFDDTVYALARNSGEVRWRFDLGDVPGHEYSSPPVVADGTLYVRGPLGTVYALADP